MVFSPQRKGGYHLPRRSHEVPRTLPSRSAQTRIAPTVLFHEPEPHETVAQFTVRFQDLYRQLADDVSPHHIPDTFLSSLREPLRTTLALTNFPRPRSDATKHAFLYEFLAEHPAPEGQSLSTSPPMHSLFGLVPSSPRMFSPATMSDLPVPISHCRTM